MNRIKDLIIQFCKFGAVGGLCFGIDYGLMIFLTETHIMHYFASSAVSFTVSVIVNYILSMRFVFTGKEDMTKAQEMVIFVALSMIGLVMNQMIMWFAVEHLGMFYAVAKIFSTMLVTTYNFISRKRFLEALAGVGELGGCMKKKRIVIALGHEALGSTLPEQQKAAARTAKAVADFIREDYQVVITHSNGPQVGMIHTAMNEFCRLYPEYTATPTSVCSAMSQGYIGYDLQNAIRTELLNRGIYKTVSTVLTQVVVDPYDEAFYHPTKVIGRVMTKEEAEEEEKKGNHVTEVEGGYRRIVASPKPMDIVEIDAISALSDADQVVIACGGGGIPVLAQNNRLQGASAVIEKDLAAGKLAELLDADMLVILTSVDKVCLNYGKEDEVKLDTLSLADAKKYLAAGEFGEGTMAPKIEAAIDFIGESAIRSVLVTKLNKEAGEITGGMGTLIKK